MRALAVLPLLGGCQLIFKLEVTPDAPAVGVTRTIHVTQTSGQAHVDFPLSVVLVMDPALRDHAAADGSDIRFLDSTLATELPSEITYDGTTGTLDAWVRIADFKTEPFDIVMVYGDGQARTVAASDVWSTAFIGVWHLSETGGNARDSTTNAITLAPVTTAPTTIDGQVGKGRSFDGVGDQLCAIDPAAADFPLASFSFGLWSFVSAAQLANQPLQPLVKGKLDKTLNTDGWGLEIEGNGTIAYAGDGVKSHELMASGSRADQWVFWRVQYERPGTMSFYVNGLFDSEVLNTDLQLIDPPQPLCFGGSAGRVYEGILDEVRVYNGVQTPQWINAELTNLTDRASFMTIGDEMPR